jgi:hypothetical protein
MNKQFHDFTTTYVKKDRSEEQALWPVNKTIYWTLPWDKCSRRAVAATSMT